VPLLTASDPVCFFPATRIVTAFGSWSDTVALIEFARASHGEVADRLRRDVSVASAAAALPCIPPDR